MIEVTDEMIAAYASASSVWLDPDEQAEVRIAAVLAIVERDRCLKPAGHVFHPLDKRAASPSPSAVDRG